MTLHSTHEVKRSRRASRWLALAGVLAMVLAVAAILSTIDPATAAPFQQGPSQPPSARNGEAIYQESCAPCHGVTGGGDGPTASSLPNGATALADPAIARLATPDGWFDVVKNGRMDRFMPPWKNRLTDEQVWDAVAYAFTLSTSEAEITRGQGIWDQECAACHGARGAGDGPQAVANGYRMPDLGDLATSAGRSLEQWYAVTRDGQGEMPAYQGKLSDDDIWAVLNHARTFSYEPLIAAAVPAGEGRIVGTVDNGTPGGAPVAGMTVTLNTFEDFTPLQTKEVQVGPDGSFEFSGLPTDSKYVYLVTTEYGGTGFGSEIGGFADGQAELPLPVTVYESTDQPGEIRADLAQWFLQPHQGGILVGELYRITHSGDHVYTGGDEVAPGKRAVLSFEVPAEAQSLVLDGGEIGDRFIRTKDGIVDTMPLAPGGRQILMRYLLPYSGTKAELTNALPYPVDKLSVLVAAGPTVQTDLQDLGQQTVNEAQWNNFGADSLPAGQEISLRLSGLERASASESSTAGAPGLSTVVLSYHPALLAAIAALSLLVVGLVLAAYLLRRPPATPETPAPPTFTAARSVDDLVLERQQLLASIAQLDDRFAAGELDEQRYQSQRIAQKRALLLVSQQLAAHGDEGLSPAPASTGSEQAAA